MHQQDLLCVYGYLIDTRPTLFGWSKLLGEKSAWLMIMRLCGCVYIQAYLKFKIHARMFKKWVRNIPQDGDVPGEEFQRVLQVEIYLDYQIWIYIYIAFNPRCKVPFRYVAFERAWPWKNRQQRCPLEIRVWLFSYPVVKSIPCESIEKRRC